MKNKKTALLFIIPALFVLLVITTFPFIYSVWISFTNYRIVAPWARKEFVGLLNFARIFADSELKDSLTTTLIIGTATLGLQFVTGLLLATLTLKERKGISFFRLAFLLPVVVTPVVTAMNFRYTIFHGQFGFANYLIRLLDYGGIAWLTQPRTALLSIILTDVWQWTSFMYLILLAGLQSIPEETIEASRVDGTSPLQTLFYITLPQLKGVISVAIIFRLIDFIRYIDNVTVMTYGGPGNATVTLSFYAYKVGFMFFETNYASAIGILLLVGIIILTKSLISLLR